MPVDVTPITTMTPGTENYADEMATVLTSIKTAIELNEINIVAAQEVAGGAVAAADNAAAVGNAALATAEDAESDAAAVAATLVVVQESIPTQVQSIVDSMKAQPNQLATLGPDGLLLLSQFPASFTTNPYPVTSQAAMLALNVGVGDIALRTDFDPDKSFILSALPASTLDCRL